MAKASPIGSIDAVAGPSRGTIRPGGSLLSGGGESPDIAGAAPWLAKRSSGPEEVDRMQTSSTLPDPAPLAGGRALFLDLDGTLAPIAPRPQDVRLNDDQRDILRRLAARLGGRLAILSGRSISDVDRILGGAVIAVAGVHGLERRGADGRLTRAEPGAGLAAARSVLQAFVRDHPALLLEDKGLGLGLHFRAAPTLGAEARRLAERLAQSHDLTLQPGDKVIELRTRGPNKGDALRAFMAEPPFAGAVPVFVGDDLTDEDAFDAARRLRGAGVLVGLGRPTMADSRLADVKAVFTWIEASMTGSVAA